MVKISLDSAAERLDASSVQMVFGNPKVQQYSIRLLLIVLASMSLRGLKRQNRLNISIILRIYFSPVDAGCMYIISMLNASFGKDGIVLFSAATSGKYRVTS